MNGSGFVVRAVCARTDVRNKYRFAISWWPCAIPRRGGGNIPARLALAIELLAKTGRSMIVHQLDEMRAHHGLKPLLPVPLDEIKDILEKTKLDEVMEL